LTIERWNEGEDEKIPNLVVKATWDQDI